MRDVFDRIRTKLSAEPPRVVATKGLTALRGLATARWHLRGVDEVGRMVRTVGAPRIENFGRMRIGDRVNLRSILVPVELTTAHGALLTIGDDTFLNYGTSVGATGRIEIGARVNVGPYVMIIDTVFHDAYDRTLVPPPKPVVIEDDVFLGAKCSIMPGVRVGRGAVVATGSVVTKDVAPFTVVGGVPARELSRLDPEKFVRREARREEVPA